MKKMIAYFLQQGLSVTTIAVLISVFSTACAQAQAGQAVMSTQSTTATVTQINQKTREVTIKMEDGREHDFVAGPEVKNLAQVKKGDVITIKYTEALAYQVREHGATAGVTTTEASTSAAKGERPAAAAAQQTTITVKITAIDPSIPTVTFMGPRGHTETVHVQDPGKLKGVKVGDMVDITYTEAIAISVDTPKK
jgi:ribosomal 50S subunit-recycling heat shock protein